ncbi:STE/STE7 protein kinase [Aphanomyces invadans]|uniref:mitogen-activated protein kinase kinase n=1 Tax=Aphanomyces invadans TaxID=157072 RepID=A0A024UWW7_9STRA|nr:STE/STE7 protein kinase [Aphanomyces invadans]ETW10412.1 STE/STE7 protein kinase [Aphanomyces invadans]|eukprot:XP_008861823.1 STE/STE7 protein kinase [Aphanomyces invadans]
MADTLEIDDDGYSDEDFDEESLQDDADVKPLKSPTTKTVPLETKGKPTHKGGSPPRRNEDSGKLAVLTSPRDFSNESMAMPKVKQCFINSPHFPQVVSKSSSPTTPSKKLPPPPEKYNALHGGPIDPSSRVFLPVKGETKHLPVPEKRDKTADKKLKQVPKALSHLALSDARLPTDEGKAHVPHKVKSVQSLAHEIRRLRSRTQNIVDGGDDDSKGTLHVSAKERPATPPTSSPSKRGISRPNFNLHLDMSPKPKVLELQLPDSPKLSGSPGKKKGIQRNNFALGALNFELDLDLEDSIHDKSYDLSASGTFDAESFQIKQTGITRSPGRSPTQPHDMKKHLIKLGVLGKGASGVVHKALHVPSLLLVAVKVIPVFENDKRHQLIAEMKTLYNNLASLSDDAERRKVACPEIVCLYDAFMNPNEGNVSIVVEYMDGGSLQDIVDTGGCTSEPVLANISYRVLKGLRYLHEIHQLHRDIKPSNLLINHFGDVKVSDFGIAKEMENSIAKAITFVGTLTYMSPERIASEERLFRSSKRRHARGFFQAYSYKSDVWSFGLSIMTCALGHYPYTSKGGYWELLHSIRNEPPPKLPPGTDFSPEFQDFLAKCLIKDQTERWSVKDLLEHDFLRECRRENSFECGNGGSSKSLDEDDAEMDGIELDVIVPKVMDYYLKSAKDLVLEHDYNYDDIVAWLKLLPPMQHSKLNRFADQIGMPRHNVYKKFEHAMNILASTIKDVCFDDEKS